MLRGCLVWSGVIRWLVVFLLFALSVSLYLIVTSLLSLHLPPCCLFAASCLRSPPPSVPVYLPPHSPHAVAVGWRGFLVYVRGCGCGGDIWKILGLLAGGRGGGGAGRIGWKSSELSAHQILVGGELGQILRAERSPNLGRRVVRIKSSKLSSHQMPVGGLTGRSYSTLHHAWLWVLWYYQSSRACGS